MQCPRIQKASVVDDFTLMVEFTNQEVKQYVWNDEVDISEYELWKNGVALKQTDLIGDRMPQ